MDKKTQKNNPSTDNMVMWTIDCTGRKLDKEGHDYPHIWGENIKPDSIEEKLYKIICPICEATKYER